MAAGTEQTIGDTVFLGITAVLVPAVALSVWIEWKGARSHPV